MPQRGDRLYKCWNGKLEIVTFLEESYAEGATALTWVVREPRKDRMFGQRIRCSVGSYFTTEKAAWRAELANYKAGLKAQIKQRHELTAIIKETRQTLTELRKKAA